MSEADKSLAVSAPPLVASRCAFPLLLGFVLIATTSICRASALQWEEQVITVAAPSEGGDLLVRFPFTNRGKDGVTIASIEPSCGCVVASAPKTIFAPGETGVVSALFEIGDNIGRHKVYLIVATDEPHTPPMRLELDVTIPAELNVEPRSVVWTLGGTATEKIILCTALPGHPLTRLSVESSDPTIAAWIEPLADHRRYRIHVKPTATDRCCHSILRLRFASSGMERHSFDAFADVKCAASPPPSGHSASGVVTNPVSRASRHARFRDAAE